MDGELGVMEPLADCDPAHIGPYCMLARLGVGGMGRVYLARSPGGRTVAVKVVLPEYASDTVFRDRFRREVAAARTVEGKHTAPVVDADLECASPWLATDYVPGPDLDAAVAAHGPLPEDSLRALGAGLAEALGDIHRAGLVHRDLKPPNVLLDVHGPCVIDFGIARAADGSSLTRAGTVIGSPGFMSPEQACGDEVTPASDVFSLGAVLVFAATGRSPFGDGSTAGMLYQVVHDDPDLTGVPTSLLKVVRACLAKDPAHRPTPSQLVGPDGAAALLTAPAGWLPAGLTAGIALHAETVMRMDTPAHGYPAAPAHPEPARHTHGWLGRHFHLRHRPRDAQR
ncbi:hypothetical protein BIV57_07910 [Mangrovactinospora gilvigrisea]|uniref:Protein kinase domain-containing protein n=1 Tax=Mangrovactinospora gilvigrisea TaxID=1428644 RepID=A0A1J7BH67_9ACTN|nr:hypothetical protein BIV57_07910 [Mangrovactinospora gilvigrisea]